MATGGAGEQVSMEEEDTRQYSTHLLVTLNVDNVTVVKINIYMVMVYRVRLLPWSTGCNGRSFKP